MEENYFTEDFKLLSMINLYRQDNMTKDSKQENGSPGLNQGRSNGFVTIRMGFWMGNIYFTMKMGK